MTSFAQPIRRLLGTGVVLCVVLSSAAGRAQPVACDDPSAICDLETPPAPPVAMPAPPVAMPAPPAPPSYYLPMVMRPALPPYRLSVHVGVTSGVTAYSMLDESTDAAAFVGADLRLLWTREGRPWGIGVRFAAAGGLKMQLHHSWDTGTSTSKPHQAQLVYGSASFLMKIHGFWFSSGLAITYLGESSDTVTLPALALAVGYDIPLGRVLALRLEASGSTLIVVNHGSLGGGLVARF